MCSICDGRFLRSSLNPAITNLMSIGIRRQLANIMRVTSEYADAGQDSQANQWATRLAAHWHRWSFSATSALTSELVAEGTWAIGEEPDLSTCATILTRARGSTPFSADQFLDAHRQAETELLFWVALAAGADHRSQEAFTRALSAHQKAANELKCRSQLSIAASPDQGDYVRPHGSVRATTS